MIPVSPYHCSTLSLLDKIALFLWFFLILVGLVSDVKSLLESKEEVKKEIKDTIFVVIILISLVGGVVVYYQCGVVVYYQLFLAFQFLVKGMASISQIYFITPLKIFCVKNPIFGLLIVWPVLTYLYIKLVDCFLGKKIYFTKPEHMLTDFEKSFIFILPMLVLVIYIYIVYLFYEA